MIVFRPQRVKGKLDAVRVAKLEVDLTNPSRHDGEVIGSLRWMDGDDAKAHKKIDEALDVEKVTKKFFKGLNVHYRRIVDALTELSDGSVSALRAVEQAGGADRLGLRIVTQVLFCWFLQKKGVLAGDRGYLLGRFRSRSNDFYPEVLEPLFYEVLGTPVDQRMAGTPGREIPFLNGGLFERSYGEASLPLSDDLFEADEGLLGFLSRWTFTVAEDTPDEVEVAVDPEMLGKVFENLISDDVKKKEGTVYTPRPVVHFMCREALVPWLMEGGLDEERARTLITDDEALEDLVESAGSRTVATLAENLDRRLSEISVLDPAVGSGAFLLGTLAEITRLRGACHEILHGTEPGPAEYLKWKRHAIENGLYGVDINPLALELCRLRLWLALVVDLPEGVQPEPLPNLDHRTIAADSLTDFVGGIQVAFTRSDTGTERRIETTDEADDLIELRHEYFSASDPAQKSELKAAIEQLEGQYIGAQLDQVEAHGDQDRSSLDDIRNRFQSSDRVFPIFLPGFHAPEIWGRGGWDVVIMNPPYLSRKEAKKSLPSMRLRDYEAHHGRTADLMILFAQRARQFVREAGVISMIFNDSIFTSDDATDLRRALMDRDEVLTIARTKCFEGKAVNGGVIVARRCPREGQAVRWVEGYRRPTTDFASASNPLAFSGKRGKYEEAGTMEVFSAPASDYQRLPSRPLFRPSGEAIEMLDIFERVKGWGQLSGIEPWLKISHTSHLQEEIADRQETGWYDALSSGDFLLLAHVVEGGVGFQTSDDKRFIAAIEGTFKGEEHHANQEELEARVLGHHAVAREYESIKQRVGREAALLELWSRPGSEKSVRDGGLGWPKGKIFRLAHPDQVCRSMLSEDERKDGIDGQQHFVPFEKGDQSGSVGGEEDGRAIGAIWWRENPLVIDWSVDAVALLAQRSKGAFRKPYFRNEDMWFSPGITWNRVTSYLRVRLVEPCIFSEKAPTLSPIVGWLDHYSLMAILNSSVCDFIIRTFLGSRMQIEVGDLRRLPIPFVDPAQSDWLSQMGREAVSATKAGAVGAAEAIREEIDVKVRDLYGVPRDADLWVVR